MEKIMIRMLFLLILPISVLASEADYVNKYCKGEIEYLLPDRTRIDCLTETHAIEYDFGKKWSEPVAQSLHYAANTGRRAGIVLIIRDNNNSDVYGHRRLKRLISHYGLPIDLEIIDDRVLNE